MFVSSAEESAREFLVEGGGQVHDRAGPQDQRLHRLVVDAFGVIEQ